MAAPTLQHAIDEAGSPIRLLWKPGAPAWVGPRVAPEFAGWAEEQTAWRTTVALSDLSFHMSDLFISGPDATRLLSEVTANNYASFAIGQAKQIVPVTPDGNLVSDGILLRTGEDSYVLTGGPAAGNWVMFHAETGGYDVTLENDPDMSRRDGEDPRLLRLQLQGPAALETVARAFGGPLPETKFFHSVEVELGGRRLRALRHGMAGQAGYEFIGDYADHAFVRDALLAAGEPHGIVHVGALAYSTNPVESGWVASPQPAIYTDPALAAYRAWLPKFSFEGMRPIHGSFYSDDIADYYVSPWELGYGRSVSFEHDFIGRDALAAAKERAPRRKVTLELDASPVAGEGFVNDRGIHRIEVGGRLVGTTQHTARIAPLGRTLALSLVDAEFAAPGTRVEVVWGEHPGHGTAPDADLGLPRIGATVQPSPYDEYARTAYRRD